METITLKIEADTRDALDDEAEEHDFQSRSAYLRDIIDRRDEASALRSEYEAEIEKLEGELDDVRERLESKTETADEYRRQVDRLEAETDRLQERVDELETELDRVKNEKRLLLEEREEKKELVRYVEQERTVEQRWREAGFGTRMKWRLFGMPGDDDE
jgi:chromosome segregation ATPase